MGEGDCMVHEGYGLQREGRGCCYGCWRGRKEEDGGCLWGAAKERRRRLGSRPGAVRLWFVGLLSSGWGDVRAGHGSGHVIVEGITANGRMRTRPEGDGRGYDGCAATELGLWCAQEEGTNTRTGRQRQNGDGDGDNIRVCVLIRVWD